MKHFIIISLLSLLPLSIQAQTALVPLPQKVTYQQSPAFEANKINFDTGGILDGKIFTAQLTTLIDIPAADITKNKPAESQPRITFTQGKTANEGYTITVAEKGIEVTSATPIGAFYASQTLLQMMKVKDGIVTIPACRITDSPRFAWRGLMLDESRHFFGKKLVKHLIDTMAVHKMNKFHWHLTDNEGWRIEIKAYPKLTSIGAWHGEGTQIETPGREQKIKGKNNPKYGGFYTQDDIKEIVAYAAARHIEIIPEIDVPGHGLAICAAYPEMLPKSDGDEGKDIQGLKGNVLSVVREENYLMLDKIFAEVAALFPSQYIHIGGDEVNHRAWANSPEHRAFMKAKGFKHVGALQNYFMLRLEKILKSHGKTLMGWNEIMHGGKLSKDTAVMAWRSINAGLHAARLGHPTIMSPGPHTYFDMKYPGHSETGHWWAGVVDTKRAYVWNPLFADQLKPAEQQFIQGVHCCLWTEFVPDAQDVDYKLWPRACATAEVGWTNQDLRHWDNFNSRLGMHLVFLDKLGVNYRIKPPKGLLSKGNITIQPAYPNSTTLFTLDGSNPIPASSIYSGQSFTQSQLAKLRYRTLSSNGRMSKVEKGAKRLPVGKWVKAQIKKEAATTLNYPISLDSNGLWFAEIRSTGGNNDLNILSAQIKSGDTIVAAAKLDNTILKGRKTLRIKLPISKQIDPSAQYELTLQVQGIKGNNNHGIVLFDKSIYLEPSFKVSSNIPSNKGYEAANLSQYSDAKIFRSNRGVTTADTFVITFDSTITTKQLILPTGKKGTNKDIIKSAELEYTSDGKTWHKGVPFTLGPAILKFPTATKIKAIRIKILADQSDWLIIRAPLIKE